MKDTVLARYHPQSDEMVELYSIRKVGGADQFVLWGVVHVDMLDGLGFDYTDNLADFELTMERRHGWV